MGFLSAIKRMIEDKKKTIEDVKTILDCTDSLVMKYQGINFEAMRLLNQRQDSFLHIEKIQQPCDLDPMAISRDYSIGYSFNLLNNLYIFCRIARRKGANAFLFMDPAFADDIITARPEWEEAYFKGGEMPKDIKEMPKWKTPDYIKTAMWDNSVYKRIRHHFDYENMKLLFTGTAIEVNDPISYFRAHSIMSHVELLKLFSTVDVLHVSGSHIGLASYTKKPYVTFPFGGDLFITPFEDNEQGWMQARGFRKANRHILGGKIFLDYADALGIPRQKIDLLPFMMDTDIYTHVEDSQLKKELREAYPEKVIFFLGARQNWIWKGNDKLWKAISRVLNKREDAAFLTVWYGQDTAKSTILMKELNIDDKIVKIGVLSKPALKEYINAVDVCIDQFTHGGLGTFSLESMSCCTPLITYYNREKHFGFNEEPPLLNAFSENEIYEKIEYCLDRFKELQVIGSSQRKWIIKYHGHDALWPSYDAVYRRAILDNAHKHK